MILCREDSTPEGKGDYVLATRRTFATMGEALDYGRSISPSREPVVVEVAGTVEFLSNLKYGAGKLFYRLKGG